jgi:VCBS repeat-containing protein
VKKEASKHFFSLSKKGFLSVFSAAVIISAAGPGLVTATSATENAKVVFNDGVDWMKPYVSLNGETISIDFSNRFISFSKEGTIKLEVTSSSKIVTLSESNSSTVHLTVKDFGDSVITVTATDAEGNTLSDQFKVKISKKGDLNGDGIVNPADVLQIYQVTSGKVTLTDEALKLLDINGDGQVTNADANMLMASYVGKTPSTADDQNYFIQLSDVNDKPIAHDDSYSTQEDTNLEVVASASVLQNDIDVEGNELNVIKVSAPANGSLTLNSKGTFTYVPDANFNGTDTFTYKVNDGKADSDVQTVTIEVKAVNDAPVAVESTLEVTEDVQAEGTLSASDVEGDALTYILVEDGKKGTVTLNPKTGAFTYKPNANVHGTDTFSFKVNDGTVDSEVVDVAVSIEAVNDAATAVADAYTVQEDTNLVAASILANDTDVDGDELSVVKVSNPAHGTLTLNPDGTFTYVPNANFNGTDTFTYKVNDGKADSEVQTVTIEVQAVNDAPVAVASSLEVTEDVQAEGTVSASDVEGDALTYSLVEDGKKGTVTLNRQTGAYTYQPNANVHGTDTFSFKVNDGTVDSEVVNVAVSIEAINDAPMAVADAFTVQEDTNLEAASILANDTDVDGDELSVVKESEPAHGSLTLNPDGTFTYVPNANFNGTDRFTYKVNDGKADSEVQTVTIEVQAVNDTPIANEGSLEVTEDMQAEGTLSANDIDGDTLTYILVENAKKGSITLNSQTGAYTYQPNANVYGTDTFSFKVNDGSIDSAVSTVVVSIAAVNDAPSITNIAVEGKLEPGETIKGVYTYTDVEEEQEGASTFKWYRGTMADGSDKEAIDGATSTEYTIQDADEDYYLFFEVTPVAVSGAQVNSAFSSAGQKVKVQEPVITLSPDPYRPDPLAPLTELELKSQGGALITLSINGDRFKDTVSEQNFVLNNAPAGTTIAMAMPLDESSIGLLLLFDGTDFDSDIPNFSVTAKESATVKEKIITSSSMVIKASTDAPTAFISEYLQGSSVDRSGIEIFYTGTGSETAPVSGFQLEFHQWQLATGQKRVTSLPISIWPNMPYLIINSTFYDAFDIMNIWYYNDETYITQPGFINNAFVLKKDGQVIDTVGDPFYNGPKPILPNGGTMVRNRGIKDGLSLYNPAQWTFYPVDSLQYFGHHEF